MPTRAKSPGWIQRLANAASKALQPSETMGILTWQWIEPEKPGDCWLIAMYPTPAEICGGRRDGEVFLASFVFDVNVMIKQFDEVPRIMWHMPSRLTGEQIGDLHGPLVLFSGKVKGRPVSFQFYALPPLGEQPTTVLDQNTGEVRDHIGLQGV